VQGLVKEAPLDMAHERGRLDCNALWMARARLRLSSGEPESRYQSARAIARAMPKCPCITHLYTHTGPINHNNAYRS